MLKYEAYYENIILADTKIDTPDVFLLNRIFNVKAVAEFVVDYLKYFPLFSYFLN